MNAFWTFYFFLTSCLFFRLLPYSLATFTLGKDLRDEKKAKIPVSKFIFLVHLWGLEWEFETNNSEQVSELSTCLIFTISLSPLTQVKVMLYVCVEILTFRVFLLLFSHENYLCYSLCGLTALCEFCFVLFNNSGR